MDERQMQIRERAGLEEARLNVEFIEFLKKYSTPALVAAAVVAGGFVLYQRMHNAKLEHMDKAFGELEAVSASSSPSPDSLAQVAAEYSDARAVPALAYLEAGDVLLLQVQRGIKEGAKVKSDGTLEKPEDALTDADRSAYLARAQELYTSAEKQGAENPSRLPVRLGAMFGLAAVAESRDDLAGARAQYEKIVKLTDGTAWKAKAEVAKARIARLDSLKAMPRIVAKADLPKLPGEEPQAPPAGTPSGIKIEPVDAPPFAQPQGPAPVGPTQPPAPAKPTEPPAGATPK